MSEGEHGEGGHGSEIPWWMSIMPDVADIGLGLAGEHGPGDIAGLGPLGIITGPLGIAAGLHEIDEGKYAEGGFGTAAGVASTTEGLASIVGAAAGEGTAVAAGAGAVGEAAGMAAPVLAAGAVGAAAGTGIGMAADSDYTRTGVWGQNDGGDNRSAMDWGANWGTSYDKWAGNDGPSVMGGIAAGAGGIVGGLAGGVQAGWNWLTD